MSDSWENHLPVQRTYKGKSINHYKGFLLDIYTQHFDMGQDITFDSERVLTPSNEDTGKEEKIGIDGVLDRLEWEEEEGDVIDYWFTASIDSEGEDYSLDSSVVFSWNDRDDVRIDIHADDLDPAALYRSLQNTHLWDSPNYAAD